MKFSNIINVSLIYATFRASTPIIYAALCAAITQQANILNVGTEGIMLMGAFMAVAISYTTGSWMLGVLAAMLSGMFMAWIIAIGHIRYKADNCAIGMGVNLLAVALTKYLLNAILGQQGSFSDPKIIGIPKVHIPFLKNIPVLNDIFNDWSITEWFVIILVIAVWFVFYKTRFGAHLRAVGEHPEACESLGIDVYKVRYTCVILSGFLAGLGGAFVTLATINQFRPSVIVGQGFIAIAAVIFGKFSPEGATKACLLFGLCSGIRSLAAQSNVVSPNLISMIPYVVTIIALVLFVGKAHTPAANGKIFVKSK